MKLVTAHGWCVSYTTGTGITGAILNVSRHHGKLRNKLGGLGVSAFGDHHGRVFESTAAASAFALGHGYLQEFRTAWCRHCRTLHRSSYGNKSGFCPERKVFV